MVEREKINGKNFDGQNEGGKIWVQKVGGGGIWETKKKEEKSLG